MLNKQILDIVGNSTGISTYSIYIELAKVRRITLKQTKEKVKELCRRKLIRDVGSKEAGYKWALNLKGV